ncbi:hypothetical protein AMELA_G00121800 [Ameiurus melas]|uniref:Death domain-containing protein n=1 Tax=Ameiurus melas TaxID=219545 RepID=A0A7J6ALP1_AMEME|nr:hypothetical protein AMELA_G00121800 [Ameiurus melas]
MPVGKQYEKEVTEKPSTKKNTVSHKSQTMHEAREVFYTAKQRQQPSPKGNLEDNTLGHVIFMDGSGRSPFIPETPSSEQVSYDLNSRAPDSVIGSMAGIPSTIPEGSEEEEQPKEVTSPEFSKGNHESPGKRAKGKQVKYLEFLPPPSQDIQQSDQMEWKNSSPPSEADTQMMEVNLQEEHDRHLFAEPVIQIHTSSPPLPHGADFKDSSDDESVIQPFPLKKYNFNITQNGLDFDPWSNKRGEEEVFETKSKDEDPKPFGLLMEDKSQATTPDTTPARTPTDDSTPTSEPNPFPFHEGKMFEMTRSGAIDMSKRDFVEERLQFFQIGEHTANGKSGDKVKGGKSVVVGASQSMAGGRALEGMEETTTSITPSRKCSTPGISGCLDAPSCTGIVGETTSCTVTASKVDLKYHIPIKKGIAASITIKKDSAKWTDFRADSSASQMLEYNCLKTHVNLSQCGNTCSESPSDSKVCPSENSNNNSNLEGSSVLANYMHGDTMVFNLQSSSEPTLEKDNWIEANFFELVEDKSNTQTFQWKTVSQKALERKCQPKSRLPVKISGFGFNMHKSGNHISQQVIKPETREFYTISIEPRSKIPVQDIKGNNAISSAVRPKLGKLGEAERIVRKVVSSQLQTRDRSSRTINNCSGEADRANLSGLYRQTIKLLQSINGEAAKVTKHLSDEEKQTQTEQSEEDRSTTRSTSLLDPSQAQPSFSDGSSRGVTPIRSKITSSAGSKRRRTRRTGRGKEGNRGTGVCGSPPIAEIQTSPQSPCERTGLRLAIVADHLGLSWTELAREMNFSVDEINHIRMENPKSLTSQSFMLLKKWVSRDGKNATTDALTAVLTKVNRMDIVTLLEGPIFDYGNISGTRSFADDSAVKTADGKF